MGGTIDIDTGGTFTDGFLVFDGRVETIKVPTTPHDLTVCFLECIKAGARRFDLPVEDLLARTEIIRFSNTIGTNCLIQRDGTKVGLLVTAGAESLAPSATPGGLSPLVPVDMVFGLDEAVAADGQVIHSPEAGMVMTAAQELIDRGARCLVVALTNSEVNPQNERLVRQTIKQEYPRDFLGSVPVFLASDITFRSGPVQRINAAVLSAYIHAKLARLLYQAEEDLRRRHYGRTLFISHNNGAVARVARSRAINTYNSGPAAGLLGARLVGRLYGLDDLISADMGGTSFDVGYVRAGQPSYGLETEVEGYQVNLPMLRIKAIGAGGGSIAWLDQGRLRVGPHSAGALPGPVSFDLGGLNPTVTDADLVLGILDPMHFLGGSMKLNRDKAAAVLTEKLAHPLGLSLAETAQSIRNQVDEAMGLEIRKIKEQLWPDGQPLLVIYGGAGPAHACDLARAAGIKRLVITPFSAVFSAYASSTLDVGHLYFRRVEKSLADPDTATSLVGILHELRMQAERDMRGEGFSLDLVVFSLELLVREAEGGREIRLEMDGDFWNHPQTVLDGIRRQWPDGQRSAATKELILNGLGLKAQAPVPHYQVPTRPLAETDPETARKGFRPVYLRDRGYTDTPIYDRALLKNGHVLSGPAVVESDHTTMLVPEYWRLTIDQVDNALLEEVC